VKRVAGRRRGKTGEAGGGGDGEEDEEDEEERREGGKGRKFGVLGHGGTEVLCPCPIDSAALSLVAFFAAAWHYCPYVPIDRVLIASTALHGSPRLPPLSTACRFPSHFRVYKNACPMATWQPARAR